MELPGRNFLLLWQGQLVSQLGNQAFLIAAAYLILDATGSSARVGAVMMAATLPLATLGPIGGIVADRYPRRAVLIATDVLRAAVLGALAMLVWRSPRAAADHFGVFVLAVLFNGTMAALFLPALQAFVADLVTARRLAAANSLTQASTHTATLLGQALGGVVYVAWGGAALLLFDALSFAYAAVATALIDRGEAPPRTDVPVGRAIGRWMNDAREGLAYVWRRPGMLAVLLVFGAVNLFFMPVFVLLPLYVRDVLGRGADWYGFLLAASGAGALMGAVVAGMALTRVRRRAAFTAAAIAGIGCSVLLLACTETPWTAALALAAVGLLSSTINVTIVTRFQSAAPSGLRGRVMAVVVTVSTAAAPLGLGLGGVMGDVFRTSLPLVIGSCGAAMLAVASGLAWLRSPRALLD